MTRVTTFRWRWKNKYGSGLTKNAKIYLSHAVSKSKKLLAEKGLRVKEVQKELPFKARRRTQVTYLASSQYQMFIRAVVINGEQTVEDLRKAIQLFLYGNPLNNIFGDAVFYVEGTEYKVPISSDEDKNFKYGNIYIETSIRGSIELHNG